MCGLEPEGLSLQWLGNRRESELERDFDFRVFFEGHDGVGQAHASEHFFRAGFFSIHVKRDG